MAAVPAQWPCLAPRGDSVRLDVSVSPQAHRTAADGLHDAALRVRLCAPPVQGRANQCLIDWLASQLGCPKRAVRSVRGLSSRRKSVEIDLPAEQVGAWLATVLPVTATTSPTPSPPAR